MADVEYLKHSPGSNDLSHMCCNADHTGVVFCKNCTCQHKRLRVFTQISSHWFWCVGRPQEELSCSTVIDKSEHLNNYGGRKVIFVQQ